VTELDILPDELLALGRRNPHDDKEAFNMAYLALRGCSRANGVSRLHAEVSRRLFHELYPGWPQCEVPINHVTNGVHVPSWDSSWADELWTRACGKGRWLGAVENLAEGVQRIDDEALWGLAAAERQALVRYARARLAWQLGQRGAAPEKVAEAAHVLDPNSLTLGFARRFADYKRPNLLLHNPERLARLLLNPKYPVQLIVAGKAHPEDEEGKRLIEAWLNFVNRPDVRARAVFLEDYDMALAQELVQGVDLWINTPRRPWEACGTSGMKVLANGGLNLSTLDGWWAEAYNPEVGWAIGAAEAPSPDTDAADAEQLYCHLEQQAVPMFYERDARGIPGAWVERMRASISSLTPLFSSNRMLQQYLDAFYRPAAAAFRRRSEDGAKLGKALHTWHTKVLANWHEVHFGEPRVERRGDQWYFHVPVYLGAISSEWLKVELYADPEPARAPVRQPMARGDAIPGAINGYIYSASVPASRPDWHFTPRLMPCHAEALTPMESGLVLWQR